MSKVIDENTVLQVGKFYNVKCAKIQWRNGAIEHVPVIGIVHQDKAFDFPHNHVHVDGRFIGKRMSYSVNDAGQTNRVIRTDAETYYDFFTGKFIEFVIKRKKCIRLTTGLNPPNPQEFYYDNQRKGAKYWAWYRSMVGKSCRGRKCPHLGTIMHEQNGKLVCPLHNLVGDIEKEVIVNLPQVDIVCGKTEESTFEYFLNAENNKT